MSSGFVLSEVGARPFRHAHQPVFHQSVIQEPRSKSPDPRAHAPRARDAKPMTHKHAKIIILGSGPAGYTAAIYAARAMLKPIVIQGNQPGGQMTITTDVENYPGFADVIQGPWLMEQMQAQASQVGTEFVMDHIARVELARRP